MVTVRIRSPTLQGREITTEYGKRKGFSKKTPDAVSRQTTEHRMQHEMLKRIIAWKSIFGKNPVFMPEKPVSAAKKIKEDKLAQGFGSMKIRMNDARLFYWQEENK